MAEAGSNMSISTPTGGAPPPRRSRIAMGRGGGGVSGTGGGAGEGSAAGGEEGAYRSLNLLKEEVRNNMILLGTNTIEDIASSELKKL